MNRETREIVAYACGDRGEDTCRILWDRVPSAYKEAIVFSDYWKGWVTVPIIRGHTRTLRCPPWPPLQAAVTPLLLGTKDSSFFLYNCRIPDDYVGFFEKGGFLSVPIFEYLEGRFVV